MEAEKIQQRKRALRSELRARRSQLTSTEQQNYRDLFTARLIELVERYEAKRVSCYLSAQDEPNTRGFLNWAFENEIEVLFPISRPDGLLDWATGDGHSETLGLFGVPEPVGEILSPIAINSVDLIIIPAAAVDNSGIRLGWGRGYYDRSLGSMDQRPPVYAVIYGDEFVTELPYEIHDQKVTGVVTPEQIIEIS